MDLAVACERRRWEGDGEGQVRRRGKQDGTVTMGMGHGVCRTSVWVCALWVGHPAGTGGKPTACVHPSIAHQLYCPVCCVLSSQMRHPPGATDSH